MATYSDERAAQILTALLKEHGIRKVIVSPGSTNIEFVFNVQNDPYFEVYSSADESSRPTSPAAWRPRAASRSFSAARGPRRRATTTRGLPRRTTVSCPSSP
ncbi:MAG: hypothetical protein V8R48_10600 [Eggerthella lenta]